MHYRGAILDDYHKVALSLADWAQLPEIEFKVFTEPLGGADKAIAALQGVAVVCVMRERTLFSRDVIEALPDLKLIVTGGMRNAAIDLAAAAERGIAVCGTPSVGTTTAELTFGLILELSRRIGLQDRQLKAGVPWQTVLGNGLSGRTLGIIGLGKIGERVAKIGQACGMNVIAWSQNLTAERCREVGATPASKEELLRQSDFVTLHVQLSPRTAGMIGAAELSLMKPTAYLINTSRGQVVNEAALLTALREKKIGGAGIDVYDVEPLSLDHPFRKLDNAVTTPHLGYATRDNFKLFYEGMVADIRAWLDGKPVNVMTPR
ncbi:MAG: D-2-hydroxyacid dehydrogenase family protein [Xanthobacteraceae bacterium]